ncbi:hypothetical protein BTO20_37800 (plasmid) [Mycobacterium dioxanotrophicus]|jgi:hypothetical protein|uniref:TrbL/VirB6 plasmid conjugal transfer protein n=1 Tax=Mycobacterium dioxanotrophicus TaxID=482462 RepID=A0A1Y0CHF0_9MYCO|nr:hypothetical protein [Mycobacterium dioxanotrophicus]ART74376.1 hypothetical protein BTO20_37800 [Mycobacterium dioxanotrophicus]
MTGSVGMLWVWLLARPRWQRYTFFTVWGLQFALFALFLFAPRAYADSVDNIFSFFGVKDAHGVALTSNMFVRADDSLADWNGVLPRIHADQGMSAGINNIVGEFFTSLIVVTAAFMLWLMRALRAVFWNELFGGIFSAIGMGIDKVLDSAPFLGIGIVLGTLIGIMMMVFGHYTGGRATIGITWFLGIFGLTFGRGLLGEMLAPSGWIDQVRTVASGIAGTLMSQGRVISDGSTAVDRKFDDMQTGFADAIRQSLQQWMLGRSIDGDAACAAAWDRGQSSGNAKTLAEGIFANCPAEVTEHIGTGGLGEGFFLWLVILACLSVGAWFAWCGLMCLFRALFYGGFAPAFIVYGLVPGFPRRFLRLVSYDFVTQVISYGGYMVLTGVYVLVLMATWNLPAAIGSALLSHSVTARMVITGICMIAFTVTVKHIGKLHRAAMQMPSSPHPSPGKMLGPAAAGTAAGLAGVSAARGGRLVGGSSAGGGGPVNNRGTSSRINAGLQAAQMMLSRAHPAAAAAGALVGGFGSAGAGIAHRAFKGGSSKDSADQPRPRAGSGGGRGPSGPAGSGGPAGRPGATDPAQRARDMAKATRQDAARIAQQSMHRPARGGGQGAAGGGAAASSTRVAGRGRSSRPAGGHGSGFTP